MMSTGLSSPDPINLYIECVIEYNKKVMAYGTSLHFLMI